MAPSVTPNELVRGRYREKACPQSADHGPQPRGAQGGLRRALVLVGATMLYNIAEAVVALWSGSAADSIALFGFGLDSVVETCAAAVLLWRLAVEARGADEEYVERSEQRVRRFIGATFLLLAIYVSAQAASTLWLRQPSEETVIGMVLAGASLIVMPIVAWGKLRAAQDIGSTSLRAEAKETLACSYLSFTLLLGLGANAALDWWWADPVAALLMVPWLLKEGREGLRAEPCCDD
jgi:divalent metal cation (Fe/Co/Zn/Cd) transporter